MIHQMFTVLDELAAAYINPFFAPTKAHAVRSFKDTCNDPNHAIYRNPDDYALIHLGEFDDTSAAFNLNDKPTTTITGRACVNVKIAEDDKIVKFEENMK